MRFVRKLKFKKKKKDSGHLSRDLWSHVFWKKQGPSTTLRSDPDGSDRASSSFLWVQGMVGCSCCRMHSSKHNSCHHLHWSFVSTGQRPQKHTCWLSKFPHRQRCPAVSLDLPVRLHSLPFVSPCQLCVILLEQHLASCSQEVLDTECLRPRERVNLCSYEELSSTLGEIFLVMWLIWDPPT